MRSVFASWPIALAKSRVWRGLMTATASPAACSESVKPPHPPVDSMPRVQRATTATPANAEWPSASLATARHRVSRPAPRHRGRFSPRRRPATTEVTDMVFFSLACVCALNRGARNHLGFGKTSTGSVRDELSDGLQHPSRNQADSHETMHELINQWAEWNPRDIRSARAAAEEAPGAHRQRRHEPVGAVKTGRRRSAMAPWADRR